MKIVTGADLRNELGLSAIDSLVEAAENAADAAVPQLESDLRTALATSLREEYWVVELWETELPFIQLKLGMGFVDEAQDIVVGTGVSYAAAKADESLLEEEHWKIDYEKGLLTLFAGQVQRFVKVAYKAGFEQEDDESEAAEGPILQDVPDWMRDAAMMQAKILLASSPDVENKDGNLINVGMLDKQYWRLIQQKVRYFPQARNASF